MGIEDIYTQIITEESRSTRNRHTVEGATLELRGVNPSCGDDITVQLREKDGRVEDAGFSGEGCAISQASTSIMVDLIKGKPVDEALHLADLFIGMIKGEITDPAEIEQLEEGEALQGVAKMPARVKCAVLPWHTLIEMHDHADADK